MKTSLTTLEGLKRSLTVELPVDTFNERTEKIIKGLASKVRVDGFRKGKVPPAVLRQRFGGSAKSDAATEIVGETLADALTDADVSPATQPSLTNIDTENADSLIYTLEFEGKSEGSHLVEILSNFLFFYDSSGSKVTIPNLTKSATINVE